MGNHLENKIKTIAEQEHKEVDAIENKNSGKINRSYVDKINTIHQSNEEIKNCSLYVLDWYNYKNYVYIHEYIVDINCKLQNIYSIFLKKIFSM